MIEIDFLLKAQTIYIKPEEVNLFKIAWESLVLKFKIPEWHHIPLFEIMQNFFLRLDQESLYIYELNCAIDVVDFFINYTERFDELRQDKTAFEIDTYAKIRFELAAREIELKYPNISQIAYQTLYSYFRNSDNFLRHYLFEFEQPPSTTDLYLIKNQLGTQRDDKMQYCVIEQIEDLKEYINEHLSKELSRKVNHFIFELLYLFNIVRYAGIVSRKNSEELALSKDSPNAKFNSYALMDQKQKSRYITTIIANAVKKASTSP